MTRREKKTPSIIVDIAEQTTKRSSLTEKKTQEKRINKYQMVLTNGRKCNN